jgi:23S rRNA pseudouridine2605 synthase
MPAERLQKIIAAAGIASRRRAEEMIAAGLVSVNGQTVTTPGTKADPEVDHIKVDGKLIHGPQRPVYLMVNKPKGYVTTLSDPEGRKTVRDLVGHVGARVFPVGRLDYASEGLLLLTNDGDLAHKLMRAATHVPKVYWVKVSRAPQADALERLRRGVSIEDDGKRVMTAPARIQPMRQGDNPWFEVTLIEGRNRQIRKMFEAIGHLVEKIKRVQYGPITLDIEAGESRPLREHEVALLKKSAEGKWHPAPPPARERMPSKKKDRPVAETKPIFARAEFVRKGIVAKQGSRKTGPGAQPERPARAPGRFGTGPKRSHGGGRPGTKSFRGPGAGGQRGAPKRRFGEKGPARPGSFQPRTFGGPQPSRPRGFKKPQPGGPRSGTSRPLGRGGPSKNRPFAERTPGVRQGRGGRPFPGESPRGGFKKGPKTPGEAGKRPFRGPRDFKKKGFGAQGGAKRQSGGRRFAGKGGPRGGRPGKKGPG